MKRCWVILLMAGLGLLPRGLFALEADEQLQFADGLYARGLHDLAAPEYEAFLRLYRGHPGEDAASYRVGECYLKLGRQADAEKAFNSAFSGKPGSAFAARAGFRLAEMRLDAGKNAEAAEILRWVIDRQPPEDIAAASLYSLGDALLKLGQAAEAATALEQLTARYPASKLIAPAFLALGNACNRIEGRQADAIGFYGQAIEKAEADRVGAEAAFRLAELHFDRKAYEESARAYEQLFARYPGDQRVRDAELRAAWALHNCGRYADALSRAQAATGKPGPQEDGRAAEWLYLTANCQRQLLRNDDASATYGRLLDGYPMSPFTAAARYEKALTCYNSGKYTEAVEQLLQIDPPPDRKEDYYWLLAESHAALGRDDQAIQYYRLLIGQFPDKPLAGDAAYRLGYLLQKRGEFESASGQYMRLVDAHPDGELAPQALFASAYCLNKAGKKEEALGNWTRLAAKYPGSAFAEESLYQKGVTEIYFARNADALTTLGSLLEKFPSTKFAGEAHYWLGVLHKEAGRPAEAEKELRTALGMKPEGGRMGDAKFQLGLVLQSLEHTEEAADLFQELASSPFKDRLTPALLEWLAEYRQERREYAAAGEAAKLLADDGKEPAWRQIGWCLLGRALLAGGNKTEALEAFGEALRQPVETRYAAESALRVAELQYELGDYGAAGGNFDRCAKLAAGGDLIAMRARAYAGLGRVAKAQGKTADAAKYFMSVAILFDDPDLVPECLREAAAAYGSLGNEDAQRQALKELDERYPAGVGSGGDRRR